MRKILQSIVFSITAIYLVSCGADTMDAKKAELENLKTEARELDAKIAALEKELEGQGTMVKEASAEILVAALPLKPTSFSHEVEVRGTVQSRKNVMVSAETMGRVEKINVEEGQEVTMGQALVKLDADILRNNISEVETSLELAEAVFVRQKNLWDQNIGTEIQYLQTKNNRDALQKRLNTLQSQLKQYQVSAPFSGIVDDVIVRVGEMAQPGIPLVRIVNPRDMYIKADVSEAFLGKFEQGDPARVYLPVQNKTFEASISSVSRVINEQNRTFTIEISLPNIETEFQPNQVAVLQLTDYANEAALIVPTKLIQTDAQGKFVYVADKNGNKQLATKKRVVTGLSYKSKTEILEGLSENDQVIEKGFRDVVEGAEIKLASL
jgi:membrane fusion protein (multidrug efflux system)